MEPEFLTTADLTNFSERQKLCSDTVDRYKYTLYGGAVGGGKSYFIRWKLLEMLIHWFNVLDLRGIEVGLFCEDYPTLKDRQLSKIYKEFGDSLGTMHDDHKAHGKCFILHDEYGGGIIKFRNLDDPSKYQSAEFAAIAVDELTKNVKGTFLDLKHRLRWPGIEDTRFFAGTNPGGIGHAWVKKLWMDRDYEPEELEEAHQYAYVPAKAEDNPHLPHSYLKQLDTLPEEMRKALRDGDWDLFKGQFFSEWRRTIHVCKPFKIPVEWKRIVCGDYGFAAPSAVYWMAISPDNVAYVYRELYKTGLTYEQLAKEVIAMTPDDEVIDYWVFDPAIWAKSGASALALSGAQIIEQTYTRVMKDSQTGKKYLRLIKGDNQRVIGWGLMREKLKPQLTADGGISAGIQFFEGCTNAIRTIPALIYDKNNIEDLDSDGEDHAADSCFCQGTMILTDRGERPIEEICVGDKVATRGGFMLVKSAGVTSDDALVYVVTLSNGRVLRGTPDHPVWVEKRGGFVKLSSLRYGDMMETCTQINTGGLQEWCGVKHMGLFRKGTTSIIKTAISGIMKSKTLSAFQKKSTYPYIGTKNQILSENVWYVQKDLPQKCYSRNFAQTFVNRSGDVMAERMTYSNIVSSAEEDLRAINMTMSVIVPALVPVQVVMNVHKSLLHAKIAVLNFLHDLLWRVSAGVYVKSVHIGGRSKVYNLSVDGHEEYYANGVLVHNCRYGLMSAPTRTRTREEVEELQFRRQLKQNRAKEAQRWHRRG